MHAAEKIIWTVYNQSAKVLSANMFILADLLCKAIHLPMLFPPNVFGQQSIKVLYHLSFAWYINLPYELL